GQLLFDDLVAEVDALVTDVDAWPGYQLLDLLLALAAEGALQQVSTVSDACHARDLLRSSHRCPPTPVPPGFSVDATCRHRQPLASSLRPVPVSPFASRALGRSSRTRSPAGRSRSCRAQCPG